MARRQLEVKERTAWHKSEVGCWSLSLGDRGCRVRVAQREPGGDFFRVTWIPGQGRTQASLHTSSRPEARRRAEAFYRALNDVEHRLEKKPLTLEHLWSRYESEADDFKGNAETTRADKRSRVRMLFRGLGKTTLVSALCTNRLKTYSRMRRTGTGWPDGGTSKRVGARSVEADLVLLNTVLNWATREKLADGTWLLQDNPIRGFKTPPEKSPRRPVATYERFVATLDAMDRLGREAATMRGRTRWIRARLALLIAEATGKRRSSIRGLRWSDIDLEGRRIIWRAKYEKNGVEANLPLPEALVPHLRAAAAELGTQSGWLFPNRTSTGPWPGKRFDEALTEAERAARLAKLDGGLWHPYRRKWRNERKPYNPKEVQAAGSWKDRRTMDECYEQVDDETLSEVINSPWKLTEKGLRRIA